MLKKVIKRVLFQPCRFWAKRHEDFKTWRWAWMGRMRARYYRLVFAECGHHLKIYGKPIIYTPERIHVGEHVSINDGCQLSPHADIYLADYVTMSRGSQITSGGLDMKCWSDERYKLHKHTSNEVYLGEGTWLCINSTVLAGVRITGKGVVVAAGSVVTHDITEDYVVVGGVPARIVKYLKKQSNL